MSISKTGFFLTAVTACTFAFSTQMRAADFAATKEQPQALKELAKSAEIVRASAAAKIRGEGKWSQVDLSDYVKDLSAGKVKQKVPTDLFEKRKPDPNAVANSKLNQNGNSASDEAKRRKGNLRKEKLNSEISTSTVANLQRRQSRTSDVMNSQMMKRSMDGSEAMQKSMPKMRETFRPPSGTPATRTATIKSLGLQPSRASIAGPRPGMTVRLPRP